MRRSILLGVIRLARGRADGLLLFGRHPQAFLASLAPLVAFPLVGGGLMLRAAAGWPHGELLATLCALLAPPVLSLEVARLWGKEALWLRFATAFNWCQWVIPVAAAALLLVLAALMQLGMPNMLAGGAAACRAWWATACGCTGSSPATVWRFPGCAPRSWSSPSILSPRCWSWDRGFWRSAGSLLR